MDAMTTGEVSSEQQSWLEEAGHALRLAGFNCFYTSARYPADYYQRHELDGIAIRLSAVSTRVRLVGDCKIISRITISKNNMPRNQREFDDMLYRAVGRYVMVGEHKYAGT